MPPSRVLAETSQRISRPDYASQVKHLTYALERALERTFEEDNERRYQRTGVYGEREVWEAGRTRAINWYHREIHETEMRWRPTSYELAQWHFDKYDKFREENLINLWGSNCWNEGGFHLCAIGQSYNDGAHCGNAYEFCLEDTNWHRFD